MKLCVRCGERPRYRERVSYCRPCQTEYQREWRRKNPEAQRIAKKRWEATHPEEVKAAKRRQYHANLERSRAYQRKRRAENPERFVEYARRQREKAKAHGLDAYYKYGLTGDDRQRIVEFQGGKCPLCNRPLSEVRQHVDHDHETGAVRGILCQRCNNRLGWYEDHMKVALAYIQHPPAKHLNITAVSRIRKQ